jgi:hypothetical protein
MAAVAGGGCGGGSGGGGGSTTAASAPTSATTSTAPAPTATAGTPAPSATATTPKPPPTTPQQAPGEGDGTAGGSGNGTGGTEPARTELTFTATSSGISPTQAGVAPYIAVKVTLVSKDGSSHKLVVDGKTLSVGGSRRSAFVTLAGLRPGKSYAGLADGATKVRILSTSEPGP